MANYYIDYENVHNEGLKGVQKLQQEDKLHLFYSIKADTLKIDVVRQLMEQYELSVSEAQQAAQRGPSRGFHPMLQERFPFFFQK